MTLSQWRETGKRWVFQGLPMRYWQAGTGEPLLLIHGFPTASWDWHKLWPALSARYQVIACDMLGFGDSAKPVGMDYRLTTQADVQQALLAHLGVKGAVHVLAHDYGDSVAQELLARHQEGRFKMASCVFLNGGLFPETHHPVLLQKLLLSPLGALVGKLFSRRSLAASFAKIFGPHTQPSEVELDEYWSLIAHNNGQQVMHKLIRYMPERVANRERWVSAMQQTQLPLRVIDGAVDPVSGAHMVARYQALMANADTVLLEGIGHYPQCEAPDQVLEHYLRFRQTLSCF